MSFFLARFLIATGLGLIAYVAAQNTTRCRNIPSDAGWPGIDHWQALNTTVSGRLIKTTPAGHVCHDPTYDTAACEALNATWIYPWGQYVPLDLVDSNCVSNVEEALTTLQVSCPPITKTQAAIRIHQKARHVFREIMSNMRSRCRVQLISLPVSSS
jgi:hypothetical protein